MNTTANNFPHEKQATTDMQSTSLEAAAQVSPAAEVPTLHTRVTKLFGIEKPIIQGAMAWVADAHLAAAVSQAGGLGIIACGSAPLAWVEEQVNLARKLTDKPIGANIMLMNPEAPALARLLTDLKVDVITTGAGSPAPYMKMWKEAGITVVPVIASVALAKRMQRAGADAVIAEGCEAGGHIGELTTMVLTPAVCDAVDIPVICAGGVADGRGMSAAFALGAEAVQVGTRFLSATECTIDEAYKDKVIAAKDSDTIVTGRSGGHPVRGLKNQFARHIRASESDPSISQDELEELMAGSLRKAVQGDVKNGSLMAGQSACLVHEKQTCQEILDSFMIEAWQWSTRNISQMASQNATRAWRL